MACARRAIFLDRDGTIIRDPGYLHEQTTVELMPTAGESIARWNQAGFLVISVSNQSGIARGLYTAFDYAAVMRRLRELLAKGGALLDADYFCPHHPEFTGPCACRKPGVALFAQAAREHGIDLAQSWWIGDRMRDVTPADAFGGSSMIVSADHEARHNAAARGIPVGLLLSEAADRVLGASREAG